MNRRTAFVLVIGLSVLVACRSGHVDMSSTILIQGSTAAASDRLPVSDAEIVLIDESLDYAATAKGEFVRDSVLSDTDGHFEIDHFLFWGRTVGRGAEPAEGVLRIEIHKGGYSSAVYSVQLNDFSYDEDSDRNLLDLGLVLLSEEPGAENRPKDKE